MLEPIAWKSKMARRLLRIFVLLVAVPVVVTVLTLAYMGYTQVSSATRIIHQIHETAILDAGRSFRQQGGEALRKSAAQTQDISMQAIQSMSKTLAKEQGRSLQATARDFSTLTRENVKSATQQSLDTNRTSLKHVRDRMTGLFEEFAKATQQRASGNIETAMLALNDRIMQERAQRLAFIVSEHVSDATNFLKLTAQMPGMSDGDAGGQKATFDSLLRRNPKFLSLTVLDKFGKETAMSVTDRAITRADMSNRADADYFRSAIRGNSYLALESRPTDGSPPVLRLSVPIEIYRGKAVGVLAARLSLEPLWDAVRSARIGRNGFASIVDKSGPLTPVRRLRGLMLTSAAPVEAVEDTVETLPWQVVVTVPRDEAMEPIQALNRDISDNTHRALVEMRLQIQAASNQASEHLQRDAGQIQRAAEERMKSHAARVVQRLTAATTRETQSELDQMQNAIKSKSEEAQYDNDREMGRTAEATSTQITERVQALSKETITSARIRVAGMALTIMLVSCGIGSIVALITAGRIVRPVVRLAEAAHAIATGDLQRRVDSHAPDEIGDLAAAFNTMADSLQKSRADLDDAEGQLVQSAKLAALGTLSAGVAHELNQPVAIIRGIAQQLKEEVGVTDDLKADLAIIEGQTGRMTKIIKHLRTFCRAGGAEFSEVDVHRTLQDCLLLIGEQLRTHNIEVEFQLCDGEPTISGDANELEQVFLNLITNARDAMDGREDARITIRSYVQDSQLTIEFRDNGPWIPPEVVERIFDPFFTTKEAGKGTGLGLSISHTIIGKHHGELRAHNSNGAVFSITLPMVQGKQIEALRAA